jgi:hypothetical protein
MHDGTGKQIGILMNEHPGLRCWIYNRSSFGFEKPCQQFEKCCFAGSILAVEYGDASRVGRKLIYKEGKLLPDFRRVAKYKAPYP